MVFPRLGVKERVVREFSRREDAVEGIGSAYKYRHWIWPLQGCRIPPVPGTLYKSLIAHLCVTPRPEGEEKNSWCKCGRKYIIWGE